MVGRSRREETESRLRAGDRGVRKSHRGIVALCFRIAVITAALTFLLALASVRYQARLYYPGLPTPGLSFVKGNRFFLAREDIAVECGCIVYTRQYLPRYPNIVAIHFPPFGTHELGLRLAPRIQYDPANLVVQVPLWIPLLAIAIPTTWLRVRLSRRVASFLCPKCAYNTTGNVSGICPECGTRLPGSFRDAQLIKCSVCGLSRATILVTCPNCLPVGTAGDEPVD